MEFAAEFGEPVTVVRDDLLGGPVEARPQEVEVLVERLQAGLGRMAGEFRAEQAQAIAQLRLAGGDQFRRGRRRLRAAVRREVAEGEVGLVADGGRDRPRSGRCRGWRWPASGR